MSWFSSGLEKLGISKEVQRAATSSIPVVGKVLTPQPNVDSAIQAGFQRIIAANPPSAPQVTATPAPITFWDKYKMPLVIGGGALAIGGGAIYFMRRRH